MTTQSIPSTAPHSASPGTGWAMVIDDHPLFCDALELTLKTLDDFTEVMAADSLTSAIAKLESAPAPALILLDLNLPDVSGLDGLIRLKRHVRKTPVIIVSSMTEDAIIKGALSAGASGFVPKHSPRAVFRDAIACIAGGGVYTPPGFVESAAEASEENLILSRLSSLTNQQARILELICEGKLNKQIAYDLSIAEATVKAHVTAIMRKLNVQSRTQAALVVQNARFSKVLPNEG